MKACKIRALAKGVHVPFLRDQACSTVDGAAAGPMLGKTLPFKRTQECQLDGDGTGVFDYTFIDQ